MTSLRIDEASHYQAVTTQGGNAREPLSDKVPVRTRGKAVGQKN